jgi:hypothetical protein
MYIDDLTFNKLFREALDNNCSKEDLIDIIVTKTRDYEHESILKEVLGIKEEEDGDN